MVISLEKETIGRQLQAVYSDLEVYNSFIQGL